MGRPRLYNTLEEKKAAKAAVSKRSYQRHRDHINEQRKINYRKCSLKLPGNTQKGNADTETDNSVESQLKFCLERSESVRSRLMDICQPDKVTYLDEICATFIREKNMECIESNVKKFDKLQAVIRKYENMIISLAGIGAAYDNVKNISQMVQNVLGDLEEISCAGLLGVDEVEHIWNARKFMYQAK